jgi:TRAP-type transport system periplasmic protein
MKKNMLCMLTSVIIFLILVGCASPAPSPAPAVTPTASIAPTSSPTTAPTKPAQPTAATPSPIQVIKLSVASQSAPTSFQAIKCMEPFFAEIEKATRGRVKFEIYYSQTLVKTADMYQAIVTGIGDYAPMSLVTYQGLAPISDVVTLPFLPWKGSKQASGVFYKLHQKYPSIQNEFRQVKVLELHCGLSDHIMSAKKQVKTLADLSGLKIRVGAGAQVDQFKALGASPFVGAAADVYETWQKGVFEAVGGNWDFTTGFRLYEIAKFWTYVPYACSNFCGIMNLERWNSLPKDIQDIITGLSGQTRSEWWGDQMFDLAKKEAKDMITKQGYKMDATNEYTVPPEELDKWIEKCKPLWDKWVKDMAAKGVPAQDMLNTTLDLIKTYNP